MRIAVFTPNTHYSGAEVYAIQMVRDLVAAGHEVLAITHPRRGDLLRDGIIATGATIHDMGVKTRGHFTARDLINPIERFAAERALFGISWLPSQRQLHEPTAEDLAENLDWALDHPESMREMAARAYAEGLLDGRVVSPWLISSR